MPTQDTKVNLVINEMDEEQLNALEQAGTVPPNQVFCTNDDSEMPPYLLNKTSVPNAVLEAPNGILTTTSNTITLKAGTVLTIPNGLNTDGTPLNIVHTIASDVSYTVSSGDGYPRFIWYDYNTNALFVAVWNLGPCMSAPIGRSNTYERYFDVPQNKWYRHDTSSTTWVEMTPSCFLTQFNTNNGAISFLVPMSTLSVPQDDIVYETYVSSTAFFRAWRSGFKEIWFQITNVTGSWKNITIPFPKGYTFRNTQFSVVATSNGSRSYVAASLVDGKTINSAYATGSSYSETANEKVRYYCCGY